MYPVLISRTFQKQFRNLPPSMQDRVRAALEHLRDDPFEPRSGADLKPVKNTTPQKYRLRVGEYRIIYAVSDDEVRCIEVFKRGRGYR